MNKLMILTLFTLPLMGCLVTRAQLRENGNQAASTQEQTGQMQKQNKIEIRQTDLQTRVSELEETLREVNGRLEVVENKTSQGDPNAAKNQKALEEQVADIQRKMLLLQEEMIKLQGSIETMQAHAAAEAEAKTKADAEAKTKAESDKKTPFDTGEELFAKKEWKKAVLSYQKYREQFPKGKKYPEATYKIGVCFQELGMKDDARTFYDELIEKFGSSPEARRAKIRLKNLK